MNYLLQQFEGDTNKLWQSIIFGRSFNEIVGDDLQAKLKRMPEPAQKKMQEALERIIQEHLVGRRPVEELVFARHPLPAP